MKIFKHHELFSNYSRYHKSGVFFSLVFINAHTSIPSFNTFFYRRLRKYNFCLFWFDEELAIYYYFNFLKV